MKIVNALKKQILSLILLFCTSILIWINGPFIKIGDSIPLLDPNKRFYIIAFLFFAWFLKFIFIDMGPKKTFPVKQPLSPEAQKKIQYLQGRFQGAIQFLKNTFIDKQGKNINLSRLPWYLLIGPSGAGKTTLLANSNINFILAKQFKVETAKTITKSDHCDWWVTRDIVLVDIPGSYFVSPSKDPQQNNLSQHFLWRHLLNLVKKFHGKKDLHGVVIALNLPEIIKQDRSQKNQMIHDLKKRLTELNEQFAKQIPVYFIITKCDLLPGFNEFFSECSGDEVTQPWGITLGLGANENIVDHFTQRFNALIKRINKQLLWRMHQERNPQARPFIKDFPLHLERLKETIAQLLKALMLPHLPLQGVYLTSSSQEYPEEESTYVSAAGTPAHFNTQSLQIMSAPPMPARSYFVRQLILHNFVKNTIPEIIPQKPAQRWKHRMVYASSAAAIITAGILLGHDFQNGVQQAHSIETDVNNYQLSVEQSTQEVDRLLNALPLLDSLQQAAHASTEKLSLTYYSNKSTQTANNVYHEALETLVLKEIKNDFETYLKDINNKNPEDIYAILKAYLMLQDKTHFQADYIAKSLQATLVTAIKPDMLDTLIKHIKAAKNINSPSLKLNDVLIEETRKQLTNLSPDLLSLVILKNMDNNNANSPIKLGTHLSTPSVFTMKSVETIIPAMYTADKFENIMNDESYTAATEATQGNWVLGMNLIVTSQATINALAAQVRTQYITNYVDIWESLIANISLTPPHDLEEMNSMLAILTSEHSPLLQLLDTIKENTSFAPIVAASPKLQSLNVLLADVNSHEDNSLYQIFINLKKLHSYLNAMASAQNMNKAVFDASAERMQNTEHNPLTQIKTLAEQSPEPMKSWLGSIAQQTWHFMLKDSAKYIESAWQKNVLTIYHAQIANRYPFTQNSPQEVSLNQFVAFLGPQGTITNFYQQFFKPFIQETNNSWQWHILDNEKIPFSDNTLAQLANAMNLQQAFFSDGNNKLNVEFALQPVSLDPLSQSFNLSINGQTVSFQKKSPHVSRILAWPGDANQQVATVSFTNPGNHITADTIHGQWAWFRLVSSATKGVNSHKDLILTFTNNGHTAKYILSSQSPVNPFIAANLEELQLPEKLG